MPWDVAVAVWPCACYSAWGPDADRQAKLLICLAVEGALLDAYFHDAGKSGPVSRSNRQAGGGRRLPQLRERLARSPGTRLREDRGRSRRGWHLQGAPDQGKVRYPSRST